MDILRLLFTSDFVDLFIAIFSNRKVVISNFLESGYIVAYLGRYIGWEKRAETVKTFYPEKIFDFRGICDILNVTFGTSF